MPRTTSLAALAALGLMIVGCNVESPFVTEEAPCEQRTAYYPDDDGDGVGDSEDVWVTCESPGQGWTETPPVQNDTDAGDTDAGDTDG